MNSCRPKSCGLMAKMEGALQDRILPSLHSHIFLGLDVSTKFTGLVALELQGKTTPKFLDRELIKMGTGGLHGHFHDLRQGIARLHHRINPPQQQKLPPRPYTVVVEEKIMLSSKGIIGSHSLTEVIVSARLATELVLGVIPKTHSPLTSRAGLKLNEMNLGGTREETKARVVAFVDHVWPCVLADNPVAQGTSDLADAAILALSGMRAELALAVSREDLLVEQFNTCHGASVRASNKGKDTIRLKEEMDKRSKKWIDTLWLNPWLGPCLAGGKEITPT